VIAANNRQGDRNPLAALCRRLRGGAAAALLVMAVLAFATVSGQALADPTGPPASAEQATADTPTTGAAFHKANYQQTAKATRAYKAGVKALLAGKRDAALAKFRESYGIVASPNSRHMIMRVQFEAGRDVEAYFEALATIKEADVAAEKSAKYKKTAAAARTELEAVKAKLALVTVAVSDAPEGSTLTVGGQEIPSVEWGNELVFLPGDLEVVLQTEAGTETKTVTLEAGSTTTVDIAPPEPKPADKPVDDEPVDDEDGGEGVDKLTLAIISGGVGVAGMVSFAIFGSMSSSKHDVLQENCNSTEMTCDSQYEEDADTGGTYQVVANVSAIVGGVGLAAGVGFVLWHVMDAPDEGADTALRPRISIGPGSVSVSGSF
jgi:hypothetical protein